MIKKAIDFINYVKVAQKPIIPRLTTEDEYLSAILFVSNFADLLIEKLKTYVEEDDLSEKDFSLILEELKNKLSNISRFKKIVKAFLQGYEGLVVDFIDDTIEDSKISDKQKELLKDFTSHDKGAGRWFKRLIHVIFSEAKIKYKLPAKTSDSDIEEVNKRIVTNKEIILEQIKEEIDNNMKKLSAEDDSLDLKNPKDYKDLKKGERDDLVNFKKKINDFVDRNKNGIPDDEEDPEQVEKDVKELEKKEKAETDSKSKDKKTDESEVKEDEETSKEEIEPEEKEEPVQQEDEPEVKEDESKETDLDEESIKRLEEFDKKLNEKLELFDGLYQKIEDITNSLTNMKDVIDNDPSDSDSDEEITEEDENLESDESTDDNEFLDDPDEEIPEEAGDENTDSDVDDEDIELNPIDDTDEGDVETLEDVESEDSDNDLNKKIEDITNSLSVIKEIIKNKNESPETISEQIETLENKKKVVDNAIEDKEIEEEDSYYTPTEEALIENNTEKDNDEIQEEEAKEVDYDKVDEADGEVDTNEPGIDEDYTNEIIFNDFFTEIEKEDYENNYNKKVNDDGSTKKREVEKSRDVLDERMGNVLNSRRILKNIISGMK